MRRDRTVNGMCAVIEDRLSGQRHNQLRTSTDRRHKHHASQELITLGTSTFESATTRLCAKVRPDRGPPRSRSPHRRDPGRAGEAQCCTARDRLQSHPAYADRRAICRWKATGFAVPTTRRGLTAELPAEVWHGLCATQMAADPSTTAQLPPRRTRRCVHGETTSRGEYVRFPSSAPRNPTANPPRCPAEQAPGPVTVPYFAVVVPLPNRRDVLLRHQPCSRPAQRDIWYPHTATGS
jgi:hypothetical protein